MAKKYIREIGRRGGGAWFRMRFAGSGGGLGAIMTIVGGMDALADGVSAVGHYRQRIDGYLSEDGNWN